MNFAKMKYKEFTFPYNPEQTAMKCDRSYIRHKYPELAGNELEDFGINAVVITGTGVFFGKTWKALQKRLYDEYKKGGVGTVSHPVFTWVTRGLMTSLEFNVQPELETVHYSFEIVADTQPNIKENVGHIELIKSLENVGLSSEEEIIVLSRYGKEKLDVLSICSRMGISESTYKKIRRTALNKIVRYLVKNKMDR